VASFIWRRDRIISLRAVTLPAGILKQVEPEKNEMRLKDGDMILMVTDGITDALGGEEQTDADIHGHPSEDTKKRQGDTLLPAENSQNNT